MKVVTIVGPAQRAVVAGMLQYNSERRGRSITADFPALGLEKGDRLDPSATLPDVATFESKPTPFQCVFWTMRTQRVLHEVYMTPPNTDCRGLLFVALTLKAMHINPHVNPRCGL